MRVTVIAAGFDRKRGSRQGPGSGTRGADVEIPSFVQG
jgi:hypothetical protein